MGGLGGTGRSPESTKRSPNPEWPKNGRNTPNLGCPQNWGGPKGHGPRDLLGPPDVPLSPGVTLAVEVAELQATVEAAAARYRQLLRQKRHLAGDSGDSQSPTGTPGDSKDTEGDTVTSVTA